MATPLDRIRAEAGVTVPGSVPKPGSAASAARRQDRGHAATAAVAGRQRRRLPATSASRRTGRPDRPASRGVRRRAARCGRRHDPPVVAQLGRRAGRERRRLRLRLDVRHPDRLAGPPVGPIVAALAAGELLVLAVTTSGFNRGYAAQSIGTAVAIVAGPRSASRGSWPWCSGCSLCWPTFCSSSPWSSYPGWCCGRSS